MNVLRKLLNALNLFRPLTPEEQAAKAARKAERNEKASMTPDQIREKLAQLSVGDEE